jgi:uncharacterized membrane protein
MPIGMILLIIVGVLVYFGLAQRLLDRMRLTDKQALLFIAAMIAGSFIDITIMRSPVEVSINIGGALLPALLCIWLIIKADETAERVRAIVASLLVAATVMLGAIYLPNEPETMYLDPKLIYGITAGLIAYIAGRSRRSAFIGGVMGIILSDIAHMVYLVRMGLPGTTAMGGAGAFDVTIIAGLVGVMTAELIGETREKLQGGPVLGNNRPEGLYEFSKELSLKDKTKKISEEKSSSDNKELTLIQSVHQPSSSEEGQTDEWLNSTSAKRESLADDADRPLRTTEATSDNMLVFPHGTATLSSKTKLAEQESFATKRTTEATKDNMIRFPDGGDKDE